MELVYCARVVKASLDKVLMLLVGLIERILLLIKIDLRSQSIG